MSTRRWLAEILGPIPLYAAKDGYPIRTSIQRFNARQFITREECERWIVEHPYAAPFVPREHELPDPRCSTS